MADKWQAARHGLRGTYVDPTDMAAACRISYHEVVQTLQGESASHRAEPSISVPPMSLLFNPWRQKDVYFGGVHAVIPGLEGAGDPRRGGAVLTVYHNKG